MSAVMRCDVTALRTLLEQAVGEGDRQYSRKFFAVLSE